MPPFQYVAPENRSANSIAALMLRPGEIEAQRATTVANAEGQAAQASGQALAGAIQNTGQAVAGTIQQATDPKRQLETAQLADLKRVQAARPILANAIKQFSDPQGGVDHEKVAQTLSAAGFPDQAESWLKMSAANAESLGKLRDSTQKHAQEQAAAIGDLAFHANSAQDFNSALGLAAASGLIDEAGAHRFAAQTDAAGPDGWQALKAKFQQYSPTWKTQQADQEKVQVIPDGGRAANAAGTVNIEGNQKPPTEAELALKAAGGDQTASAAMDRLKPKPPTPAPTEASLDAAAQALLAKKATGQPLTAEEAANLKGYQDRKRTVSDPAMLAAMDRQERTIAAQIASQQRSQRFTETQAGQKELTDKVEAPYLDTVAKLNSLRDVVDAAKSGNMVAGSVQSLQGILAVVTSEGVKRINDTELQQVQGAGNLLERVKGYVRGLKDGDPLSPKMQSDLRQLADVLQKGAQKKYEDGFGQITKRYGLTDETPVTTPSATGGGAGVSVSSPSGKSYNFPDQASADKFVNAAKSKGLWK